MLHFWLGIVFWCNNIEMPRDFGGNGFFYKLHIPQVIFVVAEGYFVENELEMNELKIGKL